MPVPDPVLRRRIPGPGGVPGVQIPFDFIGSNLAEIPLFGSRIPNKLQKDLTRYET